MENELQMTLNRLPAPTWNWLKMNESHVAYDKTPVWFSASVEISGNGIVHQKKKSMAGIELSAAWEGIWISSVNCR